MEIREIIHLLENWAPKQIAWEKDNIGLQVGRVNNEIRSILISLDVTDEVIEEAIKKKSNLVISHHPLLFHPVRNLNFEQKRNKVIEKIIHNNITLYSAHTNLDYTRDGVSFTLAKKIGIKEINFLENIPETQYKLVTFVPSKFINQLVEALSRAGAGQIGDYSKCSFQTEGTGTFLGSETSDPFIGKKGKLERVDEIRLEMIFEKWNLSKVLKSLREVHPYEEPAYDIYPLKNENVNYGMGAIGTLQEKKKTADFVKTVKKMLKSPTVKWTRGKQNFVFKVAVCGGSGSDLIRSAIDQNCDAFITADINYHSFLDFADEIALVDVGHYYSEVVILNTIYKKILNFLKSQKKSLLVFKYYQKKDKIRVL